MKSHVRNMLSALGVTDRTQTARYACREGLMSRLSHGRKVIRALPLLLRRSIDAYATTALRALRALTMRLTAVLQLRPQDIAAGEAPAHSCRCLVKAVTNSVCELLSEKWRKATRPPLGAACQRSRL
jgi:hypothetical protein